jgi:hypothetical protein
MTAHRLTVSLLLAAALVAVRSRPASAQEEEAFEPGDVGEEGEGELGPEGEGELGPEGEGEGLEGSGSEEGERDRAVKVSAFIFTQQEVDDRVATEVVAGFRRGIRADPRLLWVDPSNALASQDDAEEDTTALDAARAAVLEAYEIAGEGQRWRDVTVLLDDALEAFEANLVQVQRTELVDTTMLWAAAQCMQRRERTCESAFRRVVTFREGVEWDPRLPPEVESIFEGVREDTLAAPRGSIRIEAFPIGAEVFVDGRFVGAAPCRAEGLLAGDHYVSLKRLGYRRHVERVTVGTEFEDSVSIELVQLGNEPLLRQALRAARDELGETRVGPGMRDLWSLLLVDQLILGDLQRVGETEQFDLVLYLYDLRTRHGLNRIERRVDWEVSDLAAAEELAAELYEGVDLAGRIRPVEEPLPERPRQPDPFFRTWWFWSIIGAAVVGTTIGLSSAFLPYQGQGDQPVIELQW